MGDGTAAISGNGTLRIFHLPVGQGSATLIVGPDDTSVLVDSGKGNKNDIKEVFDVMDQLKIKQLNWVVVTHNHGDHIGGFANSRGNPKSILFGRDLAPGKAGVDDDHDGVIDWGPDGKCGQPVPDPGEINFSGSDDIFPSQGIIYVEESCGDESSKMFSLFYEIIHVKPDANPNVKLIGMATYEDLNNMFSSPIKLGAGAKMRVVIGNGYVAGRPERMPGINEPNETSLGIYVEFGWFDYFNGGDLGTREEAVLAKLLVSLSDSPENDPVDVFQVNHHGSAGSSDAGYLAKIKAEIAIISVGRNNFGHPAGEVLLRLAQLPSMQVVFMTDRPEGNFFIAPSYQDRVKLIISEASIIVATDGKTYTIESGQGFKKKYSVDK